MATKRKPRPEPEHSWERQPEEGSKAFDAFVIYRNAGPHRSQLKVSAEQGVNRNLVNRWSVEHDWVTRAEDYDDHLDKLAREAAEAEVVEMRKRHAQLGMSLMGAAALELNKLIEEARELLLGPDGRPVLDAKGNPKLGKRKLKPRDIKELADVGARIERLARGEPTEISKNENQNTTMTYAELMKKAAARGGDSDG